MEDDQEKLEPGMQEGSYLFGDYIGPRPKPTEYELRHEAATAGMSQEELEAYEYEEDCRIDTIAEACRSAVPALDDWDLVDSWDLDGDKLMSDLEPQVIYGSAGEKTTLQRYYESHKRQKLQYLSAMHGGGRPSKKLVRQIKKDHDLDVLRLDSIFAGLPD